MYGPPIPPKLSSERHIIDPILQTSVSAYRAKKKRIIQSIKAAKSELRESTKAGKSELRQIDKVLKILMKMDGTKTPRKSSKTRGSSTKATTTKKTTKKKKKKKTTKTRGPKGPKSPRPIKEGSHTAIVFDVIKESKKPLSAVQIHSEIDGLTQQNVYNILSALDKRGLLKKDGNRPAAYRAA